MLPPWSFFARFSFPPTSEVLKLLGSCVVNRAERAAIAAPGRRVEMWPAAFDVCPALRGVAKANSSGSRTVGEAGTACGATSAEDCSGVHAGSDISSGCCVQKKFWSSWVALIVDRRLPPTLRSLQLVPPALSSSYSSTPQLVLYFNTPWALAP
jgi:hypothetical protein